ncbi:hypothetical protein LC1Nh_0810 [Candidatus Nanohalobium constans]|uniref:Uncharacterized protein n=1 Tax=Candidatus Nanohalobium constans TaxID=2565781 RepID=A0A5Q0UGH6_9ARCH|nr:hypothetical protein LC1Nh_0810 [Candidatus Nanohalobium constans]
MKEELGRSIQPYSEEMSRQDALDTASYFFDDFEDADQLMFHAGKSEAENSERLELAEQTAFLMYSAGHNPQIYAHEYHEDLIEESEVLHKDIVNFVDPETTAQEMHKMLEDDPNAKRVYATNEYHVDGVEQIAQKLDDNNYLVLGYGDEPEMRLGEAARMTRNGLFTPRYNGEDRIEKIGKKALKYIKSKF